MTQQEQRRDIPGYEGLYRVSDQGNVWTIKNKRTLGQNINNTYLRVQLSKNGIWKRYQVHTLVMLAFVGPRPEGFQVDHINRVRTDNRLANLRYLHHSENEAQGRAQKNKLYKYPQFGEKNGQSKLTDDQRREIVAKYATGQYTKTALGAIYGIDRRSIGNIISGRRSSAITGVRSDSAGRDALKAVQS